MHTLQVEKEPNDYMALARLGQLLFELAKLKFDLKQGEEATTLVLQVKCQCFHSFRRLTNALPVYIYVCVYHSRTYMYGTHML